MPGPATAEELLQLVERSQVADRPVIEKARAGWRERKPTDDSPAAFAQYLIDLGIITPFHAEQLLAGRYKGFRVGSYRILRLIGVGGMGRVYLAEHAFMKRRVALKILPKSQHKESSAIERFQREAQAVAALNHPNIVHAYDSGQEGDVYFLAMEYVAGESVQDYVKQYGPVPWPYAADFIRQAALGLQHASDSGLVHRDIKPGNLLVDLTGTVKLLDLGLAMFFTEQVEGDPLTLRYNESVLGTADYLAPEQAVDSHNIDIRADIYSLGGTLYYLLSGQAPFPHGTIAQKLLWHQQKDPEPVSSLVADVPKSLEAVVKRMMAKRPEQRFATAAETAAALQPFSKPHPRPFPPEAAKQYESTAVRPHSRDLAPPTKTGRNTPRPSSTMKSQGGTAPGASSRKIPPVNAPTVNISGGVAVVARNTDAPTSVSDSGLDFLRIPSDKPPTKRDLSSAETIASRSGLTTLTTSRTASMLWVGAGAASLCLIGALVGLTFWKPPAPAPNPSTVIHKVQQKSASEKPVPVVSTGKIFVRAELGHQGPGSLVEALEKCGTNRTVVLGKKPSGEWDVEPIVIGEGRLGRCENVHIVGEKDGVVVSTQNADQPLLKIKSVKGVVLKDLVIDGNGRAAPLVTIEGDGVSECRIENVEFRNFRGDALQLAGARGRKDADVVVRNCRFFGEGDVAKGVVVVSSPDSSTTKSVIIEDNRFFKCSVGVAVQGPLASAMVRCNIFAQGVVGVGFAPGAGAALLEEFRLETSTFWRLAAGVVLDDSPPPAGRIIVADSLFVEVGSPPITAPPTVAERLKQAGDAVSISGIWAAAPTQTPDPSKAVSVGPPPSIKTVDFTETDPQKPGFLQPKSGDAHLRSPSGKVIGAVQPAA